MSRASTDPDAVAVAIMAKAPVAGLAKTRLIPALGAAGAATLQARLIARAVAQAAAANIGPVVLWGAPDASHPLFEALRARHEVTLAAQPEGDLGARMHAAIVAARGPALVIGVDCPALSADHLRLAALALRRHDAVAIPADDGGYLLIGLARPQPALFADMAWSTPAVMEQTRHRLRALGLRWRELGAMRDLDTPADLAHWLSRGLDALLGA